MRAPRRLLYAVKVLLITIHSFIMQDQTICGLLSPIVSTHPPGLAERPYISALPSKKMSTYWTQKLYPLSGSACPVEQHPPGDLDDPKPVRFLQGSEDLAVSLGSWAKRLDNLWWWYVCAYLIIGMYCLPQTSWVIACNYYFNPCRLPRITRWKEREKKTSKQI